MKKKFMLFLMVFMAFSAYSQVTKGERTDIENRQGDDFKSIAEIADFTVTDSEGVTWNLYQLLESGKTVFIDMFYST